MYVVIWEREKFFVTMINALKSRDSCSNNQRENKYNT